MDRAGQGLEMHRTEVALAVTNRCSPFPMLSRRACHAVYAHLLCTQYGDCTEPALQRTHMQVTRRERSIAGDERMDGPGRAWELHGSHLGCVQKTSEIQSASLSGIYPKVQAVWYEETQERG